MQNTVLIDLNIRREERDIMNAQEEEERKVQERLEWAKDMRLEELDGKKSKLEWTPGVALSHCDTCWSSWIAFFLSLSESPAKIEIPSGSDGRA